MGTDNRHIVVIAFQYSVVVKGIERKLADSGYRVTLLKEDFDRLEAHLKSPELFILYLPTDIVTDRGKLKLLSNMSEKINSSGGCMILIGDSKFHDELISELPILHGEKWLNRPVDVSALPVTIEEALKGSVKNAALKKILIVDDDPSYARMVSEWIKGTYQTFIVTAGMQAITFLLKHEVDLILLDYEMPVVDGPQVLQMLRQEEATSHIPVIFLTGVGTREGVQRVMELKPEGYVLKSTTRADLLLYLQEKLS